VQVYLDYRSQPSRAVAAFIFANNLDVEIKEVDLANKGEDYVKNINPTNKVPALVYKDINVFESNSIIRYLTGFFKLETQWYPSDPK